MKQQQDYIQDIAQIRSMMERSTKFMSLAGWAGIMAGIFGLTGAWVAHSVYLFNPVQFPYVLSGPPTQNQLHVILLAAGILILTLLTTIFLSYRKALKSGEKVWSPTSRRLLITFSVPLVTGGLLLLILLTYGCIGLMIPLTLIFYGLAMFNAGKYTYDEIRTMGLLETVLGLLSAYFVEYGLILWALGFGVVHIFYGIFLYYRYER